MTYLNLAEIDRLNESCAMYHTYEVSLSPLGEELVNLNNRNHIFHESEDMMKRTIQQLTGSTPDSNIVLSKIEIGTLSIITEQRIIRRIYLNNRIVPTEVDLCSSVSVLMSDNPELSRRLEIKRKLETRPLVQKHQRNLGFHGYKPEGVARNESTSHPSEDGIGMSSDPSIILASDDPRRGGRRGCSDKMEQNISSSSVLKPWHTAGRKL